MRRLLAFVLLLLLAVPALARDRKLILVVPLPQGKFPPPWTESIRVSVLDHDDLIQDHRLFRKGSPDFKAVLVGAFANQDYTLEFLCLGHGEKPVAVFRHKIKVKKDSKKVELKKMEFVELQK